MDLFSRFSRSPAKQIERLRKKVREPHGDPANRINAAIRLHEMGTQEAYLALLDRFKIYVSPSRQDEEEKDELLDRIAATGTEIVPALIQFLKRERQTYWPVEALRRILSDEELQEKLVELLEHHWESPPASSDPIAQLVRSLGELRSARLLEVVRRFLDSEDDDVLLAVLEYLFAGVEEVERDRVIECYLSVPDRPRVRTYILDRMAEKRWSVRGHKPKVEESLPEGFGLTREGVLKKIRANL